MERLSKKRLQAPIATRERLVLMQSRAKGRPDFSNNGSRSCQGVGTAYGMPKPGQLCPEVCNFDQTSLVSMNNLRRSCGLVAPVAITLLFLELAVRPLFQPKVCSRKL